jgi:hypothetical protein
MPYRKTKLLSGCRTQFLRIIEIVDFLRSVQRIDSCDPWYFLLAAIIGPE